MDGTPEGSAVPAAKRGFMLHEYFINKSFIIVYASFLMLRKSLVQLNAAVEYLPILILPTVTLLLLVGIILDPRKGRIRFDAILPFTLYELASLFLFFLIGMVPYLDTPIIGLLYTLIPPLFWVLFFNNNLLRIRDIFLYLDRLLIFWGVINAIGAILQYYVSPSLFGLLVNRVYVVDTVHDLAQHIARRAISFITSPQSLSIYLGIALILLIERFRNQYRVQNIWDRGFYIGLILLLGYAGVLTGSKAFSVAIIVYILLSFLKEGKVIWGIAASLGVLILMFARVDESTYERFLRLPVILANIGEYSTFHIWYKFISFADDIWRMLLGHGLGVLTSASQQLHQYNIFNGSAESFLIHIYFEGGLIGLILWGWMIMRSIINYRKHKEYYKYFYISVAILVNALFTPSLLGFVVSFMFYPYLIGGLFISEIMTFRVRILRATLDPIRH